MQKPGAVHCLTKHFGHTLRQFREARGWSQEMLAEQADLNRSYVGELERGQAIASLITLDKLAAAFGVSMSHLLSHTERIAQTSRPNAIELTSIAC
ncbi:MAG: helix-turn-helix transcriptional regulator [Rhodoferax sp.]|nr:helix-turn-helix transcriptional regulator [Rhodoferax sp.]